MPKIKLALLIIQIISLTFCFVGASAYWDGGWFCLRGIPAILSIALGPINCLIK